MTTDNGASNGPSQPAPRFQITITFEPQRGHLAVDGIPQDRILAWGMRGLAEEVIRAHFAQPVQKSPIVALPPGVRLT